MILQIAQSNSSSFADSFVDLNGLRLISFGSPSWIMFCYQSYSAVINYANKTRVVKLVL